MFCLSQVILIHCLGKVQSQSTMNSHRSNEDINQTNLCGVLCPAHNNFVTYIGSGMGAALCSCI
jgi:hypothetical protein